MILIRSPLTSPVYPGKQRTPVQFQIDPWLSSPSTWGSLLFSSSSLSRFGDSHQSVGRQGRRRWHRSWRGSSQSRRQSGRRSRCSSWSSWRCRAQPGEILGFEQVCYSLNPARINKDLRNHKTQHLKDDKELFKTTLPVRLAPLGIPTATSRRSPSPLNSPGFKVAFVQKIILFLTILIFPLHTSCCWISKVGVIVLSYKCQESSMFGKQFTAKRCPKRCLLTKCEIITIL